MAEQSVILNGMGPMRTTDDKVHRLRWKGGVLQYARYWTDGERQGHEWVDVPSEPADDPDVIGTSTASREHRDLMLLAAADLESWMKSYNRDAATEDLVKRLRDAALGVAEAPHPLSLEAEVQRDAGVAPSQEPSYQEVIAAALEALEDNDNHAATVILKTAAARGVDVPDGAKPDA